jgi:hypothetical protein
MKCPFRTAQMECVRIYRDASRAVYWLPEGADNHKMGVLSNQRIERNGGFVIGEATKIGFFSKKKPDSYFCRNCNF